MRTHGNTTAVPAAFPGNTGEEDVVNDADTASTLDPGKLERLLQAFGIGGEFIDFSGTVVHTPLMSRLHILQCMGHQVTSAAELELLLRSKELALHGRWLDQVLAIAADQPAVLSVRLGKQFLGQTLRWTLTLEDGRSLQGDWSTRAQPVLEQYELWDETYCKYPLQLPPLPAGYHQLQLSAGNTVQTTELIAAPATTWQIPALEQGVRMWGLSTQLYTVRSESNWGIGDFADLFELCTRAAAEGADFVLLNPLHCPDLRYPDNASPYSPDDRRFLNPLYLHLPWCEDYHTELVADCVSSPEFQAALQATRQTDRVDYTSVTRLKLQVLEQMYQGFCERFITELQQLQFRNFMQAGGALLQAFASYQASRHPEEEGVVAEPAFHCWLQWLARTQLDTCQAHSQQLGMRIGLVQDLAVGSNTDGCEVQTSLSQYCLHARIGAPPDYFNPHGQNWGLPPLLPDMLMATGCRYFRELLQANMRSCGALRIDHVMSLMRLWWCPDDGSNATGAYVYYPVELLFAILKLESWRQQCVVIGEDLGVVPPAIRDYLQSAQVFSNCVFYFEKYDGWRFRKPEHYKRHALAMMANHDVPPLLCWWSEDDLVIRRRIGMIPDVVKFQDELNWRRGEKGQILVWLQEQGLLPASWVTTDTTRALDAELKIALARACGRIASSLLSVQLDDLAGADSPVNIPGTNMEYANWRRKLPIETAAVFDSTIVQQMMQAMREGRSA